MECSPGYLIRDARACAVFRFIPAVAHRGVALELDQRACSSESPSASPAIGGEVAMELPTPRCLRPCAITRTKRSPTVTSPTLMTAEGVCWRHEGDRLSPLERGWAFRMREIVCIGSDYYVEDFRQRWMIRAMDFARSFGLEPEMTLATDPFFAPTARGKAALQRMKALKHELVSIPRTATDRDRGVVVQRSRALLRRCVRHLARRAEQRRLRVRRIRHRALAAGCARCTASGRSAGITGRSRNGAREIRRSHSE